MYQYQKDLKTIILRERGDKLKIKQDLEKEKIEQEGREHATSSIAALVSQPKEKANMSLKAHTSDVLAQWKIHRRKGEN